MMNDLKAVISTLRQTLIDQLGEGLLALYLFGSAARGQYMPGRSDIDLLLVVEPTLPLLAVRQAFRTLWEQHADMMGHGPLVATPDDLALHMKLFPSLHRVLLAEARRFHGQPLLRQLPPPPPPDPVDEAAAVAARAITRATALTPKTVPPERAQRLARLLGRLAGRVTEVSNPDKLTAVRAMAVLHAHLRETARDMPQFDWQGPPPSGDVPDLLPGTLAFYQRDKHLITVLERVDEEILDRVDWDEVGEAAEDAHALFGLATPWQLRLVASQVWVDSLFFQGFEQLWGADILGDLEVDEPTLLRQLARVGSEQRVEKVPLTYCTIEQPEISKLIHDTQNVLLNAGLRAELFTRLTGRPFDLAEWTPPTREVPQHERVAATWERWREVTAYYAQMWQEATA